MDEGEWSPASRGQYNLRDAVSRCTTQVRLGRKKKKEEETLMLLYPNIYEIEN